MKQEFDFVILKEPFENDVTDSFSNYLDELKKAGYSVHSDDILVNNFDKQFAVHILAVDLKHGIIRVYVKQVEE